MRLEGLRPSGSGYNEAENRAMIRGGVWRAIQWPLETYAGSSILIRLTVALDYAYLEAALDDLVLDEAPRNLDPVISAVNNRGFTISWPATTAPDFKRYRLVVSTQENSCSPGFVYKHVVAPNNSSASELGTCVGPYQDPYSKPQKLWRSERVVVEIDDPGQTSVTLDSLSFSGRRYFARLYVQDTQGFTNQGGAMVQELTSLDFGGTVQAPFVERFDAGRIPAGWLLEPTWGLSDEASAEPGHSAPGVLTDSPSGNYKPYTYQYARVKMDLSAVGRPLLRFKHRYSTHPNLNNGGIDNTTEMDMAFVDASRNGQKWTRLGSFNGAADWAEQAFDLSEYAGLPTVYLRFGFHDDHSKMYLEGFPQGSYQMVTRTREGWLIDDVEVSDNGAVATLPFQDDAETDGKWVANYAYRTTVGDAHSGSQVWRIRGATYHTDPYCGINEGHCNDLDAATNPGGGILHAWSWLTLSGTMDLRSVQNPTLTFWARTRGYSNSSRSQYYIQASVDGGRTWTTLPNGQGPYIGGPEWQQYTFSLDGFQAPRTLVRIGNGSPAVYDSWQEFDDFEITGTPTGQMVSGTVEFRLRGASLHVQPYTVVGLRGVDAPLSTTETTPLSDPDGDGTWTARVPFNAPLGSTLRYLFVQLENGSETNYWDCKQGNGSNTVPANYLSFTYTGSATIINTFPCSPVEATPGEGVSFFTVTGGGAPYGGQKLSTGFHPQATLGLDPLYGEHEQPPAPPTGEFAARFVSGGGVNLGQGSLVDLRPGTAEFAGTITHQVLLQRATGGGAFRLDYDLPDQVRARLRDALTGTLFDHTFAGKGFISIPASGDMENVTRFTLAVTYGETCVDVTLTQGWNMVSMPLVSSTSMQVTDVYPGTTNHYGFGTSYENASSFVPGKGYWLKSSGSTPRVCGAPVTEYEIPLQAGWNMIGGFEHDAEVSALVPSPADVVSSSVFAYNGGYSTASQFLPGKGYWVKARSAGTLRVEAGSGKGGDALDQEVPSASVTVTTADGARTTLYFVDDASHLERYALPPLPPSGLFDARFVAPGQDDRLAAPTRGGTLALQSATGAQLTGSLPEGQALTVLDVTGQVVGTLVAGQPLSLPDGARFTLLRAGEALPDVLALEPVMPNPARELAAVRFALPEAEQVKVAVYDVLGREVLTLFDGPMTAGTHTLSAQGGTLASGLYVIRLEADSGVRTRSFVVTR